MIHMTRVVKTGLAIVIALALASTANALPWPADAGGLPATAQVVEGSGPLTKIIGEISDPNDADMYKIYLTGSGSFSASTHSDKGGFADFDTELFLFNSDGFGVYANDDYNAASPYTSHLPAGHALTPADPGVYYLLITGWHNDPVSDDGLIFPNPNWPDTVVQGPTGPGGGSPISGYTGEGSASSHGLYMIKLTGAEFIPVSVPEPATLLLLGSGLLGLGWFGRKRMRT